MHNRSQAAARRQTGRNDLYFVMYFRWPEQHTLIHKLAITAFDVQSAS